MLILLLPFAIIPDMQICKKLNSLSAGLFVKPINGTAHKSFNFADRREIELPLIYMARPTTCGGGGLLSEVNMQLNTDHVLPPRAVRLVDETRAPRNLA